jgi:hypothetical protein
VFAAPRQLSMPADFGPPRRVTDRAGGLFPVSLTLWRRRLQFRGAAVVRERIGEGFVGWLLEVLHAILAELIESVPSLAAD